MDASDSESSTPDNELEGSLLSLANSLHNLATALVTDLTKDGMTVKPLGDRVNEIVDSMDNIDSLAQGTTTMLPAQVIADIDDGKNPEHLTRERIERTATENQFMNGKIIAIQTYMDDLNDTLASHFPELGTSLRR